MLSGENMGRLSSIRAQKRFWEIMPNDDFIARPPDMTKIKKFRPTHMNGMCVDVTLTDKEATKSKCHLHLTLWTNALL